MAYGLGGFGFRFYGLGFRVQGCGLRVRVRVQDLGLGVYREQCMKGPEQLE